MVSSLDELDKLIAIHQNEASEGIVDVAPSRLNRGQGTQKKFYILKIDLVGSTELLMGRSKDTYLKLAHTFLSTIDKITNDYGADAKQTEYAGDSVLAYFPENVVAENVLRAACFAKVAVERIAKVQENPALSRLKCRVVLHYASLTVAKIGPRADSILNAIGAPIHRVAKLEKEIGADVGRTTLEFYNCVNKANRSFFTAVYNERQVLAEQPKPLFGYDLSIPARILYPNTHLNVPLQYRTESTLIGYDLNWRLLKQALNLEPRGFGN